MVSILPPQPSAGTMIGQGLGQGLATGLERGGNVGFQRGLLQESLGKIRSLAANPNSTPIDILSGLMEAGAGIPGSEKYIAQFAPLLLESAKASSLASPETTKALEGLENRPGAFNQEGNAPKDVQKSFFTSLLGDKYFPEVEPSGQAEAGQGIKPIKPPITPKPIGPAEESRIRRALIDKGIKNPYLQNELIKNAKEYQTELYDAQKQGYKDIQEYQQAKLAEDQRFFGNIAPALEASHGQMNPQQLSIWHGLSRESADLPDEQRFANTEKLYNEVAQGPLEEFDTVVSGLPYFSPIQPGLIKDRMEDSRSFIQDQLKRIDERTDLPSQLKDQIRSNLRDSFMSSMAAKDFGVAQAAYAVSNLSPETASSIPMAPPPKETFFDTVYLSDPKIRDQKVNELSNSLLKMKPDDSLILMREKALKNNYDDRAFNEALRKAISTGKLRLSDYQNLERNRLSIPQRLDINSVMEGKRNVYDYFKRKQ